MINKSENTQSNKLLRQYKVQSIHLIKNYEQLPKSYKRNGIKNVICNDCKTEFMVRKDTNPVVCKRCASVRGGKSMKGNRRAPYQQCKMCDNSFRVSLNQTYCSPECRKKDIYLDRSCKLCKVGFKVLKKSIGENTNASGNFCNRKCYDKWLCRTERTTGRGSQWKRIRDEVIKEFPHCAVCGTNESLQVHHIVPFRLTKDNSKSNLIPLCVKHHRTVESMFLWSESEGLNDNVVFVWKNILRNRQYLTMNVINRLWGACA